MEKNTLRPLVSVIIPVHNGEKHLADTIHSCLAQEMKDLEIIIVCNATTDRSIPIAKSFSDPRITVLTIPEKSAAVARNLGLSASRGAFIQFLDADDLLSSDKLRLQTTLLQKHPGKVAVCSTVHFMDGEVPYELRPDAYEESFLTDAPAAEFLLNLYGADKPAGSMVQPNAWLVPRHVADQAGPWNEQLTLDDDGEYFCRVVLQGRGVVKSGGTNYYRKYRRRGNLSSRADHRSLLSQLQAAELKVSHLKDYAGTERLAALHGRWLGELRFRAFPGNVELATVIGHKMSEQQLQFDYAACFPNKKMRRLSHFTGWRMMRLLQWCRNLLRG